MAAKVRILRSSLVTILGPTNTCTSVRVAQYAAMQTITNLRLWRMQDARRKLRERFNKAREGLVDQDKIQQLHAEWQMDFDEIEAEIAQFVTMHLRDECERLFIPLPDYKEKEFWTEAPGCWHHHLVLSTAGIDHVRKAIRLEKAHQLGELTAKLELLKTVGPWLAAIPPWVIIFLKWF